MNINDYGKLSAAAINHATTGIDSLLNESRLDFKRGQTINFLDSHGKPQKGKYVMASSAEGYIVLNIGGKHGTPKVVSLDKVLK